MTDPVEQQAGVVVDSVSIDVRGRMIEFLVPEFAQLALIQHQGRVLASDDVDGRKAERAFSLVYRTIRSWVLVEADLDYIEDLLADRQVSMEEILSLVTGKMKERSEGAQKPVVRRGRPRKAAR